MVTLASGVVNMASSQTIDKLHVAAFTIPTDAPEADGTLAWTETTLVIVELTSASVIGTGYTYANVATANVIHQLARHVIGQNSLSPVALNAMLYQQVRNLGREGIASMAISAIDVAAWDLKARLEDLSLCNLVGPVRNSIAAYGSGGFTSYSDDRLARQLGGWVEEGLRAVKMKVGSEPDRDPERVKIARKAIGDAQLFVDANGAYDLKQASTLADQFAANGVVWFEEPVSSDDLAGLAFIRQRVPGGVEIAAGEYGYNSLYFRRMLQASAVDVLQADATRCGGITGFLNAAALADSFGKPLSAHTAPSLHGHLGCVATRTRNVEYFHDHVRIEQMLFDGALKAIGGVLTPNLSVPGLGITFRRSDAEPYQVFAAG